jgi:hypothetical protein
MLCTTRRSIIAAAVFVALVATAATAAPLSLRTQAGMLTGLAVGGKVLHGSGVGGFYVQPYRVVTGNNLVGAWPPARLPAAFSVDRAVTWQDKPTIAVALPDDEPADSGELVLTVPDLKPHRTYLIRFAHRGEKLAGEFPPILHLRLLNDAGEMVHEQFNVDLYAGSYDWMEQIIPVPAVEGASQLQLMLHHPRGLGRFWFSDIEVREVKPLPLVQVPGQWMRQPGRPLSFTGLIPGTEVTLGAIADEKDDDITMSVGLSAPTEWLRAHPMAFVLSFRVPVDATGWRWGDYIHQERTIEPGKSYLHYEVIGSRQFREVSRFPLAAVAGPEHGLALAVPMAPTLFTRLRYDGSRYLCAEFDLGLAARSDKGNEQVRFSFDLLRFAPRWGYREALATYYRRYPALFASTAKEGGWWIGPSEQVEGLADFGMQYSENHFTHSEQAKANDEQGVYTCSYSEPWMWRILVSEGRDLSLAQPVSSYWPKIEYDANRPPAEKDTHDYWTAPRRDSVRAFLNSVTHGPDGKPQVQAVRTYAGTYIEMATSCLPGIRSQRWGDMNRGLLSYDYETKADIERCAAQGAKVDGVYFDSVGNWSGIANEDHRQEHFAFASFPLTFSYATGTPVISGLSAMAEYMGFIKAKGFVTMANSDESYVTFAAPYLDMIGAGENFYGDDSTDEIFSHDRAVAYHKSVSFGNTGMLRASPEEADRRFRLLLFYHIYPGIFAGDPAALEAVGPLFRRYVPLMQQMGAAGWEPVTQAAVDDPAVRVERYGPAPRPASITPAEWFAPVYFALRNPTDQARTVTLSIEEAPFGAAPRSAVERLSERTLELRREGGTASVTLEVAAHDTAVVLVLWK